jgi:hypothetical protein
VVGLDVTGCDRSGLKADLGSRGDDSIWFRVERRDGIGGGAAEVEPLSLSDSSYSG